MVQSNLTYNGVTKMSNGTKITDSRDLLRKADIALSDLTTGGGLLQPE